MFKNLNAIKNKTLFNCFLIVTFFVFSLIIFYLTYTFTANLIKTNKKANFNDTNEDLLMTTNIKTLIDQSIDTESPKHREDCLSTVTSILSKDPELTEIFIEFYILKNENDDYVSRGLEVARRLYASGNFNYTQLLKVANDNNFYSSYRNDAIRSIGLLLNKIDESIYLDFLNSDEDTIKIAVVSGAMINLSKITDRNKAFRILKSVLQATKHSHPNNLTMMLGEFIDSFDLNEDVFSMAINGKLEPHEAVIISVSFLNEKWPDGNTYRKIAEDNSKKSALARAYLEAYLKLI